MEQFNPRLSDSSAMTRPSERESSLKSFDELSEQDQQSYLAAVMVVVNDSYTLAAQMPTMAEKANTARVWSRYLCGAVPERSLQKAFERAYGRSNKDYPVTPQQILSAWGDLAEEHNEAIRKQLIATAGAMCTTCLDTGFTYHRECRPNGKWYDGVVKSTECCNYWPRRLQNDIGQGRKHAERAE